MECKKLTFSRVTIQIKISYPKSRLLPLEMKYRTVSDNGQFSGSKLLEFWSKLTQKVSYL